MLFIPTVITYFVLLKGVNEMARGASLTFCIMGRKKLSYSKHSETTWKEFGLREK